MPLKYGLLRSYQIEPRRRGAAARTGSSSPAEGFFNDMDPTIFDLSVNDASVVNGANPTLVPTTTVTDTDEQDFIDRLTKPQHGRSYGLEVLLRRAGEERAVRLGLVHAVALRAPARRRLGAVRLRSHPPDQRRRRPAAAPQLGLRRCASSTRAASPSTTTSGYNTARTAGYVRFDLRVDKRAVWRSWLLDFYVDVTNIALLPEEVTAGPDDPLRAADRRPARPVLTRRPMTNDTTIDAQLLDLMLRAGSRWVLWLLLGLSPRRDRGDLRARLVLHPGAPAARAARRSRSQTLAAKGPARGAREARRRALDGGGGRARVPRPTPPTAPARSRSTRRRALEQRAPALRAAARVPRHARQQRAVRRPVRHRARHHPRVPRSRRQHDRRARRP